jgi:FecR protein
MKIFRIFLVLALITSLGGGCFGLLDDDPNGSTVNSRKITQAEVETYKKVQKQVPKGIAYLEVTPGASVIVTRGSEETYGKTGMALYAGDQLEVAFVEVTLIYPDSGASLLSPDTKVTILPDGDLKTGQGIGALIILEAGKIFTRFERVFRMGEKFSVQADNVVATVRGTAFGVKKQNDKVGIQVAESNVTISTRDAIDYMGFIPEDFGWEMSAGQQIELDMEEFLAMAEIEPLPDGAFAYFDSEMYFDSLFEEELELIIEEDFMDDLEWQWIMEELSEEDLDFPDDPYFWEEPPMIDEEFEEFIDPDAFAEWEAHELWMLEHEMELLEAERIRAEMEAEGMFMMPEDEWFPEDEWYTEDGGEFEYETVYYDENGNPYYPEVPIIGYDEFGNPIYGEPVNVEPIYIDEYGNQIYPEDLPPEEYEPEPEPQPEPETNNDSIELLGVPAG